MNDEKNVIQKIFDSYLLKSTPPSSPPFLNPFLNEHREYTSHIYCIKNLPLRHHHIHYFQNRFYLIVEPNYEVYVLDEKYTEKFRFLLIMAGVKI